MKSGSKIYTRTGDNGTTALADGRRTEKDAPRVEAIGCVDELNSAIGNILARPSTGSIADTLTAIQRTLFELGAELADPGRPHLAAEATASLEKELDRLNGGLPPLKGFILPRGGPAASACHLSRAICRRTERRIVALNREQPLNPEILKYLNRLSDLLFIIARALAAEELKS